MHPIDSSTLQQDQNVKPFGMKRIHQISTFESIQKNQEPFDIKRLHQISTFEIIQKN